MKKLCSNCKHNYNADKCNACVGGNFIWEAKESNNKKVFQLCEVVEVEYDHPLIKGTKQIVKNYMPVGSEIHL